MSKGASVGLDVQWLEEMLLGWVEWAAQVPVLSIIVNYIAASLHHDPWRLFLEAAMLVVLIRYLFGRRYRPKDNSVKLTKKEVDDLIDEWQPEPLVPALSDRYIREMESIPVIEGTVGPRVTIGGQEKLNFASYDFLGLVGNEKIEAVAKKTLRNYGVGSCGPPGFYGTIDVHMTLEKKIAELLGTEEAILYSYGFSTIASTIPAFAKRGDLIICDEGISFALQKGVIVSRATVKYFKHNDTQDLERILKEVKAQDQKSKKRLNRRFILSEGLFQYSGDICPLPQLVELKTKYKYRLIIDETLSFGTLGSTGKGVCQHFNVPVKDVDILTGCLANSIAAAGGYCAGSTAVVDHQRLSGQGYCYSASMPALLAASAIEGLDIMQNEPQRNQQLRKNTALMRNLLAKIPFTTVTGNEVSPLMFLELKKHFANREDEEDVLQDVVNEALKQGLLVSRSKLIIEEEIHPPFPSIRVCVSQAHAEDVVAHAAEILISAFAKFESKIQSA